MCIHIGVMEWSVMIFIFTIYLIAPKIGLIIFCLLLFLFIDDAFDGTMNPVPFRPIKV